MRLSKSALWDIWLVMENQWIRHRPDPGRVKEIAASLRCEPVIAAILVNRGISGVSEARSFLSASPSELRSPFLMADMDVAVERIRHALVKGEKILVFGDYDADGVTAAALLTDFLHLAGGRVSCRIPHRARDGYGLNARQISDGSIPDEIRLIITVDCGISGYEAVEAANAAGIDVIVTDHHIPPERLPRAVALVNPNRPDCGSGLGMLAGVGVVFFLVMALRKHLRDSNFWGKTPEPNLKMLSDLVAMGTIADMVPLTGENRILTRMGIGVLNSGIRPGVRALMEVSGHARKTVGAEDIAFKLTPRLNAAGRVAHAETAYRLLVTKDAQQAAGIARNLDDLNRQRRQIESDMLDDILARLERNPRKAQSQGIVMADGSWHEGVLGIVASRLVRRLGRPVVLFSITDGVAKGSGRSVPGLNLFHVLEACADDLDTFGGHAMAAGIRLLPGNIPAFEKHFVEAVVKTAGPDPPSIPLFIDAHLDFDGITKRFLDQLEQLKPFGTGNPAPLFMAREVTVIHSKIVGKHHRRMRLTQKGANSGRDIDAILFNVDPAGRQPERFDRIAYRPRWNRWNGARTLQLVVEAVCP